MSSKAAGVLGSGFCSVSSGGGRIGSMGGEKTVSGAIDEITRLQEIIKTECNERFHYGVFYSWQSIDFCYIIS